MGGGGLPGTATEETASGWHRASTFTCWKVFVDADCRCLERNSSCQSKIWSETGLSQFKRGLTASTPRVRSRTRRLQRTTRPGGARRSHWRGRGRGTGGVRQEDLKGQRGGTEPSSNVSAPLRLDRIPENQQIAAGQRSPDQEVVLTARGGGRGGGRLDTGEINKAPHFTEYGENVIM